MPYIEQTFDGRLEKAVDALVHIIHNKTTGPDATDGMLNYSISRIVSEVLEPVLYTGKWRYTSIARAIAAFECAKLEFYRRVAGPKEDRAIESNGDLPAYGRLP